VLQLYVVPTICRAMQFTLRTSIILASTLTTSCAYSWKIMSHTLFSHLLLLLLLLFLAFSPSTSMCANAWVFLANLRFDFIAPQMHVASTFNMTRAVTHERHAQRAKVKRLEIKTRGILLMPHLLLDARSGWIPGRSFYQTLIWKWRASFEDTICNAKSGYSNKKI